MKDCKALPVPGDSFDARHERDGEGLVGATCRADEDVLPASRGDEEGDDVTP
jgi:hypothetical protein